MFDGLHDLIIVDEYHSEIVAEGSLEVAVVTIIDAIETRLEEERIIIGVIPRRT